MPELGHTDAAGGALSRYPAAVLEWCQTDNFLPYRVPVGPVTGYRAIGDWIDIEGRITRNFYSLTGGERTHAEVWRNYREALSEAGFEIIAEGLVPERNVKGDIGGGGWLGVYYINNPWQGAGAVNKLVAGTSTSGGTGAVFGRKVRADDTIYALVSLEQHSADEVAAMTAVRAALVQDYGIASDRLEPAGVGPLVPVFMNATDGGRAKHRRVELVARE